MLQRLGLASIRRQIFLLAALPIFLLAAAAAVRAPLREVGHERTEWASFVAGKVVAVAEQVRMAGTDDEAKAVLQAAARSGLSAELTERRSTETVDVRSPKPSKEVLARLVDRLTHLSFSDEDNKQSPSVSVQIDEVRSIVFHPEIPSLSSPLESVAESLGTISLVVLPVLLLSYYLSYRITQPLVDFAAAAWRISLDKDSHEPFSAEGAAEIRSLGDSLNVMRGRINRMIEERTSLLRSLGHDLRTPLTRLQMRAERCKEPELQRLMLLDITTLTSMIDENMRYLSDKSAGWEPRRKVDLTSLLQTIAADYADMSIPVSFSGPRRLVYTCMPRAMTRALSNLIDNASRYAAHIDLKLSLDRDGNVLVDVRDDGPGLSDDIKKRALEPFFKGDSARTLGPRTGGVGLGLPIANGIAKAQGGTLSLLDREPHGLVARITLPADRSDSARLPAG